MSSPIGTAYVQADEWSAGALYAAVGIGAIACAILVANNLRDIPTDRGAGKHTLAVRLGDERTRSFYVLLMLVALAALAGVAAATGWWALVALVYVVPSARAVRVIRSGAVGPALIPVLQLTGVAELLYGLGLLVGLAVGN